MAQTIALQRGTTSLVANGTNSVTLFTQSGGTATKVIFNQLGFYFDQTPTVGTNIQANVIQSVSGGQGAIIGRLLTNFYSNSFQFPPGGQPNTPFTGVGVGIGSTSQGSPIWNSPVIYTGTSGGLGAAPANGVSIDFHGTSATYFAVMSNQFYMGDGDSITMKIRGLYQSGKNQFGRTAYISYEFVTITES